MYWYDFGRNDVYIGNGGKFKKSDCKKISPEEKEKITTNSLSAEKAYETLFL